MGDTIGRYELDHQVAEGALAILWRGRIAGDAGFRRAVAIRELRAPLAKDRRFVGAWAAIAAELAETPSPHAEQVLDVVVHGDRALVISEWIEGLSLERWIAAHEVPVPWPLAVEVAIEALRGLADAHQRPTPLVHDGVLPGAVRIAHDGTVKLTRFGAAGALAATGMGRRRMEELGVLHPAPERVSGEDVGPATDLHGVGALLFEMLTGAPPFGAEAGADRDLRITGEPPDLVAARPDVPPLLAALVERTLRVAPDDRFTSATEMARALTQLLRSHPEPTGPEVLRASVSSLSAERALPSEDELDEAEAAAAQTESTTDPDTEPSRGAAALAASVRAMLGGGGPPKKRPQGLTGTAQRTMHVDAAELVEIAEAAREAARGAVAEVVDTEPPPAEDEDEPPRRYRFEKKERTASESAARARESRGLEPQESEAAPLPLTPKRKPKGLSPAKTEFLDEDQVDRLTLPEGLGKKPAGLSPAKTEFLDEDQIDRLRIDEDD